jgi:glutamyl-tRNA synthetase
MNSSSPQSVVVRVPPSPTGNLHIGTARTALFNYLFARHHGGSILFRSEDTDRERSKPEYEKNIIDGLSWLGISFTNKVPIRQSERTNVYKTAIQKLLSTDKAYISKEDSVKEGGRSEVIRFRNPNMRITFNDIIRGEISFDTTELKDFIIAKSIEEPLYHLAVVVDDIDSGVTHVIRGEDHISNTPRQILLIEALGATRPHYAHIPLILAPDRSKLSKRHGAVAVSEYRSQGFMSEALINYLALLGWNPGTENEVFTLDQLIEQFDLAKVQKGGAIFNIEKLKWFNREHIKRTSQEKQKEAVASALPPRVRTLPGYSDEKLIRALPILLERITVYDDVRIMGENGELDYFFSAPSYSPEKLLWKGEGGLSDVVRRLTEVKHLVNTLPTQPTESQAKEVLWPYAESEGRGAVLWPLRYCLSGLPKSPDPFTIIALIGRDEALARITHGIAQASVVA